MMHLDRRACRGGLLAWLSAATWLGAMQDAGAQSLSVLTGEHAGFTRIVLLAAGPFDWSLGGEGTRRVVELPAGLNRIDLSRAFERIPRTRLLSLSQSDRALELTLACPCEIRAWQDRPGLVILDVTDPSSAEPDSPPPPAPTAPVGELVGDPRPALASAAQIAGRELARRLAQTEPVAAVSDGTADALQMQLSRSLAESAGFGLLTPAAEHARPPETIVTPDSTTSSVLPTMMDLPPNLRLATALDRSDTMASSTAAAAPDTCVDAHRIDALLTEDEGDFGTALAGYTQALYAEFDAPDPTAFLGLAWFYLRQGMGAEARAVLSMTLADDTEAAVLQGVADTVDDLPGNSRYRLAGMVGCGGAAALVAAAASADADALRAAASAIAIDFPRLPFGLRAAIGPAIARNLIDAGALDAARSVTDALRRGNGDSARDAALLEATLTARQNDPSRALAALPTETDSDANALALRLAVLRAGDMTAETALLSLAEAVATAQRGTDQGRDLMAEVILGEARMGRPVAALAALDRLSGWLPPGTSSVAVLASLRDAAWESMVTHAEDREFLTTILARGDWRDPGLRAETRIAMAGRLNGFGLADHARSLLPMPQSSAERMMRAEIELAAGSPQSVPPLVTGLDDPRAIMLHAAALEALGAPRDALALYERIGDEAGMRRTAIATEQWATLTASADPTAPSRADAAQTGLPAQPTGTARPATTPQPAAPAPTPAPAQPDALPTTPEAAISRALGLRVADPPRQAAAAGPDARLPASPVTSAGTRAGTVDPADAVPGDAATPGSFAPTDGTPAAGGAPAAGGIAPVAGAPTVTPTSPTAPEFGSNRPEVAVPALPSGTNGLLGQAGALLLQSQGLRADIAAWLEGG